MAQTERFKKDQLEDFKAIGIKLIYGKSASLNLGNSCKLEIILVAFKNDHIKEEDKKAKAKQLRNKK